MAFPSKKRDLRTITTNDHRFRWRFNAAEHNSLLVIYSESSGAPLQVTLCGWQDSWVVFPISTNNSPTTIGPASTRTAIDFALECGWNPDARGAAFEIEWDGEKFRVA